MCPVIEGVVVSSEPIVAGVELAASIIEGVELDGELTGD